METYTVPLVDFLNGSAQSPIPLEVIPNNMGIALAAVHSLTWTMLPDGQLVSLTINFKPAL